MRVGCIFEQASGELREVAAGEIIGRSWNAALRLPDPRISEAHAMVSLRGSTLRLIALRGRFAVDDKPLQDIELRAGLAITLATGVTLRVHDVVLPHEVLALEGDGLARHVLAGVSALYVDPRPRLVPGLAVDAPAVLWHDGLGWIARIDGDDRPLVAGDTFEVGGVTLRAVSVAVGDAGHTTTRAIGGIDQPITIVARYDSVHILRDGEPTLVLGRHAARILSELATIRVPVAWEALAREIWTDEPDPTAMRRRFDASLARLRQKLRDARLRADLVRADGAGNFELNLLPADTIRDET